MIEVKERPKDAARGGRKHGAYIRKIGVIGAGQMGNGIAHVCALAGFHVLLNDVAPDRIKAGLATINGNMARQVSRKRITEEERQAALKRIAPAETLDEFGDCDLVIEAATEKEDGQAQDLRRALSGAQAGRRSSAPTRRRSRSRGWPPRPTGRRRSSAFIS